MPVDPRITVVVCTFQGGRHVGEQIASVLTQTLLPAVILVTDDGSTDDTLEVVKRVYDARTARAGSVDLRVVSRVGGARGVAANAYRGVEAAGTSWVALCDQDDRWLPTRLERTAAMIGGGVDLVGSDARLVDAELGDLRTTVFESVGVRPRDRRAMSEGRVLQVILRGNLLPGMTMLLRRDFVLGLGPVPPPWIHDHWWALWAAAAGGLRILDEPLVEYRQHSINQIGLGRRRSAGERLARSGRLIWQHRRLLCGGGVARRVEWADWRSEALRGTAPVALARGPRAALDRKVAFECAWEETSRRGLPSRVRFVVERALCRRDYAAARRRWILDAVRDVVGYRDG